MQSPTPQEFRLLLRQAYIRKREKNPSYSLRAFARSLGVNHALLSLFMNGKRKITPRYVLHLGTRMGLSAAKLEPFLKSSERKASHGEVLSYVELTADQFELLSSWKPDAILELARVQGFEHDPQWVSERLGISVIEARDGLERLERLGILNPSAAADGALTSSPHTTNIPEGETTQLAQRAYQKSILELSAQALDDVELERRSHTSMTLAVPSSRLGEAKDLIRKFRREFTDILQRPVAPGEAPVDSVYQLAVSFFPLTVPATAPVLGRGAAKKSSSRRSSKVSSLKKGKSP
jgi:uncharacterized protein (TIGR02147 family)